MKRIISYLKTGKWAFWAFLSLCVAILSAIVYQLFLSKEELVESEPSVSKTLQEKADKTREEVLVSRIEIKAKTKKDLTELKSIVESKDGVERRKKLAAMLNEL